jgi:branched-chain amino acid transport system substrate-binding protein
MKKNLTKNIVGITLVFNALSSYGFQEKKYFDIVDRPKAPVETQASRHINNSQKLRQIVKIGHVGPLSGAIGHLGIENENAAIMAIDKLNASGLKIGGKYVKFELLKEDDAADPKQAIAAAQRLVAAKVNGVIGHLNSGASIPASLLYNFAGIPQISPSATNPKYTRQGYSGAFRLVADDVHLGRTLGKFAVQNLKGKNIAIIDDRTAYGSLIAEEFKNGATALGGAIVAHGFTNFNASDFTILLTRLKENNPDIIFFGGMDDVASQLLRQMNLMGIKAKFLGGDGICTSELAFLAREAMKDDTVFCAEAGGVQGSQKEGMDKFRNDFKAKFNTDVQIYAPYVYDAVMVMAAAMVQADSAEPAKYLSALKTIKYQGVTGSIEFDEKGDIKNGAITIYTFRNRQRNQIGVIR